jgi:hypothetical protein
MSTRAKRLEEAYLIHITHLTKTTHDKTRRIGVKSLAAFVRALIDECPQMNLKTAQEMLKISEELENIE